jgi:hypothetical protein
MKQRSDIRRFPEKFNFTKAEIYKIYECNYSIEQTAEYENKRKIKEAEIEETIS